MAIRRLPKELDSRIEIVHGWFMEIGDSQLRAVRNGATEQPMSFLAMAN